MAAAESVAFVQPRLIEQAVECLETYGADAKVVAGATALTIMLRQGLVRPNCTPGFILTTKALLEEKPNATRAEARDYLAGNLCRCGSYVKIMEAVLDARDRLAAGRV